MHNVDTHTCVCTGIIMLLSCFKEVRSPDITSHVICFADFSSYTVIDFLYQMAC